MINQTKVIIIPYYYTDVIDSKEIIILEKGSNSTPFLEIALTRALIKKVRRSMRSSYFLSGIRESDPPPWLGKPMHYRCANPAFSECKDSNFS